jgi:hypothetical protein
VKQTLLTLCAKIVIALVYAVLAGEAFMRIFSPQPMLPRYVSATDYGVRGNTPNRDYWHKTPEYRVQLRTNSRGIRADREIPYEKPPGIHRILLLGDSFGMGYGVNLQDMFLTRCVEALKEAGVPCEAVNLAVSGFGNAEELIALKTEGLRYDPDLVIVQWHITDLEDNTRSNLFSLDDGRLVRKNETYLPAVRSREWLFQSPLARWLAVNSHLYCVTRERAARFVKFEVIPAIQELTRIRPRSNPDTVVGKSGGSSRDGREYRAQLAAALLKEIQQVCHDHGAAFMILDVPLRLSRTRFRSTFPRETFAKSLPFHVYDPIPDFAAYLGEKLYWERSHGHFTPLGCQIVGEGLARMILDRGLLQDPTNAPAERAAGSAAYEMEDEASRRVEKGAPGA